MVSFSVRDMPARVTASPLLDMCGAQRMGMEGTVADGEIKNSFSDDASLGVTSWTRRAI